MMQQLHRPLPDELGRIVLEWGEKAHQDLIDARYLLSSGSCTNAAFHAQQCAEKALKGVLVLHQREYPYTHDIAHILDHIAPLNRELAERCAMAATLTPFAVAIRYPGEKVEELHAREAVETAGLTYERVKRYVATHGINWP